LTYLSYDDKVILISKRTQVSANQAKGRVKQMSTSNWTSRINGNQSTATQSREIMWTREGANFQERALSMIGADKSHSKLIGELVTAINNNRISVEAAERQFNNAIFATYR
jgi:hypothetical protein